MAASGEKPWPRMGRNHGRGWGETMAADGEKQMAVDKAAKLDPALNRRWRTPVVP